MTVIYVIYGLIVVAALGVPYRISQRAKDNAMLRDATRGGNSKGFADAVEPSATESDIAKALGAPDTVYARHPRLSVQKNAYCAIAGATSDVGRVYLSHNRTDLMIDLLDRLYEHDLTETLSSRKRRLLRMKQAYILAKTTDVVNGESQSSQSAGQWGRAPTASPGFSLKISELASAVTLVAPDMKRNAC